MFPKTEAFSLKFNNLSAAVLFATSKRKFGGCFDTLEDGFVVYWLLKDDPRIPQFAW